MKLKSIVALLILAAVCLTQASPLYAEYGEPYKGYHYDAKGRSVPSPNGYVPETVINGAAFGIGQFNSPQDMVFDVNGNLYVLDSGNARVIEFDRDMKLRKVIDQFTSDHGEEKLNNPQGIYVTPRGEIMIADTGNARVIITDRNGRLIRQLGKPDTDLISKKYAFKPTKVVQDQNQITYVLSEGLLLGAISYDPDGHFLAFYGSNDVEANASVIIENLWKRLLTKEQRKKMMRAVPIEFSNFDLDPNGFMFTVTKSAKSNQIKMLNYKGDNIFPFGQYGDLEMDTKVKNQAPTSFTDIDVDPDGFLNVLDTGKGRIFQYNQRGDLITVFGGFGEQAGTFKRPTGIESWGDRIYVLDAEKRNITVFKPTTFALSIRNAEKLYNKGLYQEAVAYWEQVLTHDANYERAYEGIGKAKYESGDYAGAMQYYRLGQASDEYSQVYKEYRKDWIRHHFLIIFLMVVALLALSIIRIIWLRKRKKTEDFLKPKLLEQRYLFPLYTAIHPVDGYEQIKLEGKGSRTIANLLLGLWFVSEIVKWQYTGFVFNASHAQDFNILFVFIGTILVFILWCISNWALCTLIDGIGKFKDIWISSAYALLPYICSSYLGTWLSNYMVAEERGFLSYIDWIGKGWSLLMLLTALLVIHKFTVKKSFISLTISVIGMGIILFLFALFYGLMHQMFMFFNSVYQEIMLRL